MLFLLFFCWFSQLIIACEASICNALKCKCLPFLWAVKTGLSSEHLNVHTVYCSRVHSIFHLIWLDEITAIIIVKENTPDKELQLQIYEYIYDIYNSCSSAKLNEMMSECKPFSNGIIIRVCICIWMILKARTHTHTYIDEFYSEDIKRCK